MIDIAPEIATLAMFGCLLIGLIVLGHPVAFVLGGVASIFAVLGWGPEALYLFTGRIFDSVTNQILIAIPLFVVMASFLDKSGVAAELFRAMMHLFGPVNGGMALAVVVLATILAACTGVIGASVVSMSLLAMPAMMKQRYDKGLAVGSVAAGGCLGILIPPSIMLVMMADQSGISVGKLFAGGFVPGFVLSTLYVAYILIITRLDPKKGPALSAEERASLTTWQKMALLGINLVPPLVLILGVLGSIWLGVATPTEASGVGALIAFLMMVAYGKFKWNTLLDCIWSSAKTTCMVMATLLGASVFTGVFLGLGGGKVVTDAIMAFGFLGKWGMFAVMMGIVFLLGFLIDWIGIIYITFPIFLPIAAQLGFDKVWFIITVAVNLQTSFLTPPFGYALFYMKGTSPPGITTSDIYRSVVPFVTLQILGLLAVVACPSLATYLPSLIK